MKIAFLIARFHPFKGGAEIYTLNLARMAVTAGHEVIVYTTDAVPTSLTLNAESNFDTTLPKIELLEGIKIVRVHRLNNQLNLGFYPALFWEFTKLKTDILHVTNGPGFIWHDICVFWHKLVSKIFRRKTKYVCTPHGPFLATPTTHSGIKKQIALIARRLMFPYFWLVWKNLFDLFLEVNPKQKEWMQKLYHIDLKRIKLIPNGISSSYILKTLPRKSLNPIYITYVGRIEKYKGVHLVLKALAMIKETNFTGFKFRILGKPDLDFYPELLKLINAYNLNDLVEIIPNPSDIKRDEVLDESSIFILHSQWEATGIVLLEAMARGNTIFTTYQNEAWDLIINSDANSKNGFVHNYADISQLASDLADVMHNTNQLLQMQSNSLNKASEFMWEYIYPKYAAILEELIASVHK